MLHIFMQKGPWFRAKRYGYGAGLPFKWQGWAVVALYASALAGVGLLSKQDTSFPKVAAFAMLLIVTAIFVVIVHKRTEGGWKWRWGGDA
jgi:hypothetical protein